MPRDLKRELITTIANLSLCTTLLQKQNGDRKPGIIQLTLNILNLLTVFVQKIFKNKAT